MNIRFVVGGGVLAVLLAARAVPARAADAPGASPPAGAAASPATKAEARERFDRGVRLFEKGENAGALAEFKRAYELIPNPLVLYNMGLVYAAMNRPIEATDALQTFLASGAVAPSSEQRKKAERVRAEQATRIAQLMVVTDSPATIEVDGIEAGRTPLQKPIRVAIGAHVVAAVAPGFLPTRKELTLPGQVTETVVLNLTPTEKRMAQLVVRAALPGAEVMVNDKRAGVTPLPASVAVAPGLVKVELRRPGYRSSTQTVSLDEGARGELAFRMDEDPAAPAAVKGRLRVTGVEPGVEVLVDGQPREMIGGAVVLVSGPHTVRVQRGGFEPFEQTVDVVAQGDTPLSAALSPTPETRVQNQESARFRRVFGWSLAGAGAVLAVAGGVYAGFTQKDVSSAHTDLDTVLANERDVNSLCYAMRPEYTARGCDVFKSDAQDRVDSTTLHRNLALVGAGVGVVAVVVGGYLLMSTPDGGKGDRAAAATAGGGSLISTAWTDGHGGGVLLLGRF
ncbi:MAG TPA: PEGA domain-containing protein [Polyangia bacterium]|nr:PEGA domain-containing protein [Polyangia bacterium]